MREPQARRDQREIVVPARSREPRAAARRRPAAGVSGRFAALTATAAGAGRAFLRHPGEILGVGVVLGAVSLICLNALGYQAGRHPAPIFPKLPPQALAGRTPEKPKAAPSGAAAETAPSALSEAPKADASRPGRDTIGELIKGADPKGTETTASVSTAGSLSLAQAQRALVKLGYGPLKADGLMGPGTRAALEKFERDRKLPVKGEPTPRTLRELAARAGVTRG